MRQLPAVLTATVISCVAFGQTYTISTFAGGGPHSILEPPGTLEFVSGTALDAEGNLFFTAGNTVLRSDVQTGEGLAKISSIFGRTGLNSLKLQKWSN